MYLTVKVTGMKILEKRKVRSHNKVRALFAENKVRFARAKQLCLPEAGDGEMESIMVPVSGVCVMRVRR